MSSMAETREDTHMTTITITLANGTSHSKQVRTMPKHWKSVLLRSLPYGTDVQGAAFSTSK